MSPGKNTIVVLEVKYSSVFRAYSESVVQWVEFRGQDEHGVAVGVTQYTLSAEQERMLMSSAAIMTVNTVHQAIACRNDCRKVFYTSIII